MKSLPVCILALMFVACKHPAKNSVSQVKRNSQVVAAKRKTVEKEPLSLYDSTVYKKYIPASVFDLMHQYLPEWNFPAPSSWEKIWFDEYKKGGSFIDYTFADFNGDGKTDYAFILDSNKVYAFWVLQSEVNKYIPMKLVNIGASKDSVFNIGISLYPKGKLDYIDFDNDNPEPIHLKNPAITIEELESMAETYYWKDGKYESVTTGD